MTTTEFTGHVGMMRADNEFYGAEDFIGRGDVSAQIVQCLRSVNRKACGVNQKEMFTLKLLIDGKPAKKEFWIKSTNRKMLTKLYGPNVNEWKNKWIWLFVEECRSPQGGMTFGVRIRDRKDSPTQKQSATTPETTGEAETAALRTAAWSAMKDIWKEWQVMRSAEVSKEAFASFVESTTQGAIKADDAFKPTLFDDELLKKCKDVIAADFPSDSIPF